MVYRYKTLALKWHPKLSKYDPDLTYHNFCEISEAYEVLGDSMLFLGYATYKWIGYKRAFYDKYGEEQLKDGFIVDGSKNVFLMKQSVLTYWKKISEEDTDSVVILKKFSKSSLDLIILSLILLVWKKIYSLNESHEYLLDDSGKEELGSMFGFAFKGLNYEGAKSIPNLEVPVDCTLNELYNGCSKEVTYTRVVLNGDGQTTRNIQETKYSL